MIRSNGTGFEDWKPARRETFAVACDRRSRYNVFMMSARRIAVACLFAALFSSALRAQPISSEQLRLRRDLLARQREQYERSLKSLPSLGKHQMADIMSLRIGDRRLVLHTTLQPWPNFTRRRADIEGFGSPATVSYTQFIAAEPSARQFEFNLDDYPDADTFARLHVVWRPEGLQTGELTMERTEQSSAGFTRILFVQNARQAQLMVFSNREPLSSRGQNFSLSERDFMAMRERHSVETERWLRPLFRRLRQDAAFAPDVNSAWQVLVENWPVDDATVREVRRLLPELGSEEPRVRSKAAADLARLGRDGATVLLRTDRTSLSLEQTARMDELLSRFRKMPDEDAAELRNNSDFLIDCLYCDDAVIRRLATEQLARFAGHSVNVNPDADPDARAAAIEKLRGTLRPATQPASAPTRP